MEETKNFIISEELLVNVLRYILESNSNLPVKVSTELVMKLRNLKPIEATKEKTLKDNTKVLKKK